MTGFVFSLISAIVAFSYYFVLWLQPSLLSENADLFGVLVAFICLHIALRRFIGRHTIHVLLLVVSAGLFTFYRSFIDGRPFLYALIGLHAIVVVIVILTVPLVSEEK
ncbi:hypothetical protein DFO55_12478 [Grimontella sp. AG753]|nr:hypothetical protein DFO55_12478 [Grimontella sp. AG753]